MCGTCGCGSENNGPTILKPGEHQHVHNEDHHHHDGHSRIPANQPWLEFALRALDQEVDS